MPITRYTKYLIGVKSSTSINTGERCKVTNLEGRGIITGEFKTKGNECILNPANSNLEWVVGDKLMIEISGRLVGSKEVTLTAGGIAYAIGTVTTTADTTSPAIDL